MMLTDLADALRCEFAECDRQRRCNGLCQAHYMQQYRGQDLRPLRQAARSCSVEGCARKHVARGYCGTHYTQARRGDEPGAVREVKRWPGATEQDARRWQKYRVSPEDYAGMLAAQSSACGSCGATETSLVVDHDHDCCPGDRSCGECVRGLLCRRCNIALGIVGDDPAVLRALITYLEARS